MRTSRPEATPSWSRRNSVVLSASVVAFFVGSYLYNTVRLDADTLRADQWFWMNNVVIPFDQGRLSLFDAITYEYGNFAHSHIPTLAVLLVNRRFFDIDLTVDAVIGSLSLLGVLALVALHCRRHLPRSRAWLTVAASSSLLFMSSHYSNFAWSLIQFQMLYVFVAFVYLAHFARQVDAPSLVHALVVVPITLVLGDAIGAAAVLASLFYLVVLALLRHVRLRSIAPHLILFPIQLLALHALLRGARTHSGSSLADAANEPIEMLRGSYYAFAGAFIGLQRLADRPWLVRVGSAPLWFALAGVVVGCAAIALRRTRLEAKDHFPLMVVVASAAWSFGVLKARVPLRSADAMQEPRYAAYTALFGVGLLLYVAGRFDVLGRGRAVFVATMVVVVGANAVGTLAVTTDPSGPRRQDAELASLERYATGADADLLMTGPECDRGQCQIAAWYLLDERLGPFSSSLDAPPQAEWEAPLRGEITGRFLSLPPEERLGQCITQPSLDDEAIANDVLGPDADSIHSRFGAGRVDIPADDIAMARQLVIDTSRALCGG